MTDNLIAEALDLHVLSLEEERALDGRWHPSSMFQCVRMNVLAVRGVIATTPADAQAKRVFRIGHLYHELVQNALPGHPKIVEVYPEFKVDVPEWNVVGAGDALIKLDNEDWYVVEIKSTKSLRYTPKEDHVKQASVYFTAARDFGYTVEWASPLDGTIQTRFDPPLGAKLKGILLVYLNKQDLEIKQYVYPYLPKWRREIEKRIVELDFYRKGHEDQLPPPLPKEKGKPNWYLGYCQFRGSGLCCADEEDDW